MDHHSTPQCLLPENTVSPRWPTTSSLEANQHDPRRRSAASRLQFGNFTSDLAPRRIVSNRTAHKTEAAIAWCFLQKFDSDKPKYDDPGDMSHVAELRDVT
ncbi:hypothetical protein GALMADRAFT_159789 [Galerina marginata CBS 339.88]|uniref:Uncharacterized protein n=1 Tax=Galerina marginata (strain CBS 339.88) TaxID=685588 RepID=A0A067SSH3_GALM3|nr:hypothetical protein GALMADRAFT_159789 [Galerina marginata CBS 339.88]